MSEEKVINAKESKKKEVKATGVSSKTTNGKLATQKTTKNSVPKSAVTKAVAPRLEVANEAVPLDVATKKEAAIKSAAAKSLAAKKAEKKVENPQIVSSKTEKNTVVVQKKNIREVNPKDKQATKKTGVHAVKTKEDDTKKTSKNVTSKVAASKDTAIKTAAAKVIASKKAQKTAEPQTEASENVIKKDEAPAIAIPEGETQISEESTKNIEVLEIASFDSTIEEETALGEHLSANVNIKDNDCSEFNLEKSEQLNDEIMQALTGLSDEKIICEELSADNAPSNHDIESSIAVIISSDKVTDNTIDEELSITLDEEYKDELATDAKIREDLQYKEERVTAEDRLLSNKKEMKIEEKKELFCDDDDLYVVQPLMSERKPKDEELINEILKDLDNVKSDRLFEVIRRNHLNQRPKILAQFIYFIASFKETKKAKCILKMDDILAEVSKEIVCMAYLYAIPIANKNKRYKLNLLFHNNIKAINKKSVFFQLAKMFARYKVIDLSTGNYKRDFFKGIEKLFLKHEKHLSDVEYDVLSMLLMDSYGNVSNENYQKGMIMYKKFSANMSNEAKEYCLIRLGDNYLLHGEFRKATKVYSMILEFTSDDFDAQVHLMLSQKKASTYEELFAKKKLTKLAQYKELKKRAEEEQSDDLNERIAHFEKEAKVYTKKGKDDHLAKIRKTITFFAIIGVITFGLLGYFLQFEKSLIYVCLSAATITLSDFITVDLKSKIKRMAVKFLISAIIIAIAIILL